MSKSIIIARWEFFERIKRKSFIISMIVVPVLVVGFSLFPSLLFEKGADYPLGLGVVDLTKKYQKEFSSEVAKYSLQDGQPAFFVFNLNPKGIKKSSIINFADNRVLSDALAGYVIIEEDPELKITYRSKDILQFDRLNLIENAFNKTIAKLKSLEYGIDEQYAEKIKNSLVGIQKSYIDADTEEDIFKSFINSYLFIILLITMILFSGGMFVRSLVLEKSNRIIELILSSCTSKELLLGKVLGLSFLGLFQLIIWMIIGILLHKSNTVDFSTINNLHYQLVFFVLGYTFYSSMFIGLGSLVGGDQEAQQLTGVISIFLIFPIVLAVEIIRAPNSLLAIILSYFPITSVPVMLLRLNSTTPTIIEVASIILFLLFSIYLVILVSSKLFRFGVLITGKRPSTKEIISWLKIK